MSLSDDMRNLGANVDDALSRFMGNEALYLRMLAKLPKAIEESEVMPCFEEGDKEGALAKAHTLKGVTGNLSVTPLFDAYSEIVSLLRSDNVEEAKAKLEAILPKQAEIIETIKKYS